MTNKKIIEVNPIDLLGDNICDECGTSEWIDTGGYTSLGERILRCNKCNNIVYGCD